MVLSSFSSDCVADGTPDGSCNTVLSSPWMFDSEEDVGARELAAAVSVSGPGKFGKRVRQKERLLLQGR